MTEQLSLRLEPDLPRLQTDLRPMFPRMAAQPFDSAEHLFEPSWNGVRALAFVDTAERGPLRLVDADGRDLAPLVPELAELPTRILARSAVLDGELVVVDASGRADPAGLAARLGGLPGPAIAYLAFDLLALDGRPLLREPLERRRRLLRRTVTPGESVVIVPAILGEGIALHAAVRAQGVGAVMARVRTSPYLAGQRSRLWRKIEALPLAREAAGGDGATGDPAIAGDRGEAPVGSPSSPVLALIRRLPFDEEA